MRPEGSFRELCKSCRFQLDDPAAQESIPPSVLGEMVARVRSNGLRATPTTTPAVFRVLEQVAASLALDELPEVYIVNDASANAFAPAHGRRSRPFVVVNSGLVSLLGPSELAFAIGHELGHLGMEHGNPHGRAEGLRSEYETLQARSRQRHAEISADRVGLLATRSLTTAAKVMVKMASGLPDDHVSLDVDAFLSQLDRDEDELRREWELHESHPALPLRLWALMRFSESQVYTSAAGHAESGRPLEDVDAEVAERLAALGDGLLGTEEEKQVRSALTWMGLSLVVEDERIDAKESEALRELVGEADGKRAIAFVHAHGLPAVRKKLEESLQRLSVASRASQLRVVDAYRSFAMVLGQDAESTTAWARMARRFSVEED